MNTPSRSPLGAFYRSTLGVRMNDVGNIYVAGGTFVDNKTGSTCNTELLSFSGRSLKAVFFGEETEFTNYYAKKIFVDSHGDVIVSSGGSYYDGTPGKVSKCSKSGTVLWTYDPILDPESTADYKAWIDDVFVGPDDNVFALCSVEKLGTGDVYLYESYFLRRLSPTGEITTLTLGMPSGYDFKTRFAFIDPPHLSIDSNGDIIVFGDRVLENADGSVYYQIAKWNKDGTFIWSKNKPGIPNISCLSFGVNGDFYFTTYQNSDDWDQLGDVRVYKYNASGILVWSALVDNDNVNSFTTYDIILDKEGDVYIAYSYGIRRLSPLGVNLGIMSGSSYRYFRLGIDSFGYIYALSERVNYETNRYESLVSKYDPKAPPGYGGYYSPILTFNSQSDAYDMVIVG